MAGSGGANFNWLLNLYYNLAFNGSFLLLSIPLYYVFERIKTLSIYNRGAALLVSIISLGFLHVPTYFFFLGLLRPELVAKEGGMIPFLSMELSFNYPLMIGYSLFYGFVVICLLGVDYYNQFVVEKNENEVIRSQLRDAHLQNLKMKLHPHFLFNSLNTASMLIVKGQKDKAMEFLEKLGELLRQSLTENDQAYVTLEEEMDFIEQYLCIEKIRFGDRLHIEMDIPSNTKAIQIPHLIAQPLVENAFKYGFSKTMTKVTVRIKAAIENSYLTITVFNNGPSLEDGWILDDNLGNGLNIVISRLKNAYEGEAEFYLRNKGEEGVEATLVLPIRNHE